MDGRGNVKKTFVSASAIFMMGIGQKIRSTILVAMVPMHFVAWMRLLHAPKSCHLVTQAIHSVHVVIRGISIVGT